MTDLIRVAKKSVFWAFCFNLPCPNFWAIMVWLAWSSKFSFFLGEDWAENLNGLKAIKALFGIQGIEGSSKILEKVENNFGSEEHRTQEKLSASRSK